jgi:hypothetical protein
MEVKKMALEALERIITQRIKMNLQDSSQRSQESLQKLKERKLKKTHINVINAQIQDGLLFSRKQAVTSFKL